MTQIGGITEFRQVIVKPEVLVVPSKIGGRLPSDGISWRVPVSPNAPGAILPLLDDYLLGKHELLEMFVARVAHVASEALINAGRYGLPGSEMQVGCKVVGFGDTRRCTVQVFHYVAPTVEVFPQGTDIPAPDQQEALERGGRGLPIMKQRADSFALEDLPGNAKEVTLSFDLNSPIR